MEGKANLKDLFLHQGSLNEAYLQAMEILVERVEAIEEFLQLDDEEEKENYDCCLKKEDPMYLLRNWVSKEEAKEIFPDKKEEPKVHQMLDEMNLFFSNLLKFKEEAAKRRNYCGPFHSQETWAYVNERLSEIISGNKD